MSERSVIPLGTAVVLGFLIGLIAAVMQLEGGSSLGLAIAGSAVCAVAGLASVAGVDGDRGELAVVAGLRAGLGVALFASIYVALLSFLRDGSIALFGLLLAVALGLALLLAQLSARGRPPADERDRTAGRRGGAAPA